MKVLHYLSFVLLWLAFSCVTPYNPDTQSLDGKLVVDGNVTDQPGRNGINLTLTTDYTVTGLNFLVTKATVYVIDDRGQRISYRESTGGNYQPVDANWKGQVGRTYTLFIQTTDGRQYQSTPQLMRAVPPIDTLYYEYTRKPGVSTQTVNKGFDLYIDTKDPATPGDYYRWRWKHYELINYCRTNEVQQGPSTVIYGFYCCETCWDIEQCYGCNNTGADTRINGNKIARQPIVRIPYNSTSRYYVEVEQESLTPEAYQYWNTVSQLTQNNGGIFDATPVPLKGNITCTNRTGELAFGFFGASSVSLKATFVDRSKAPDTPDTRIIPIVPPGPLTPCSRCVESPFRTQITPRFWKY
ncbi:DUF4249 domain-containing protein [Rudanella lutea]|uniref:DUF4249 domain-containing protein n=1 Tax=Rudanella lutea TaxID=451374 RepID=UPI00037BA60A|nr:DUF4249 domain-containing protein [Rudanella lutea]